MTIFCKYCNNKIDSRFFDYGNIPLVNNLLKSKTEFISEKKYPLDLYFCENCGLVQIGTTIDPEILFKEYIYFSSTSDAFIKHGQELAQDLKDRFNLNSNSLVVEIASNDGCVLQSFKDLNIGHLGVEPATNIAKVANQNGIRTENEFFNLPTAEKIKEKYGSADLIFGINVFAHIPEIHGFVKGLKQLIKQKGVIVIESPYLVDFIKNREFDTVYHEHVNYLSLRTMINLFAQYNMEIIDVEWQDIHGGSLRYFITNNSEYKISGNIQKYLDLEKDTGLNNKNTYLEFAKSVNELKIALLSYLDKLKQENKKIVGYGASAKGVVLLNYFGIDEKYLDYVVDKSQYKQGLYLPGVHLPIYDPKKLLDDKPDYVLLLTWNFEKEILKQQEQYRNLGGKFIIPIPNIKVL